MFVCLFVSSFCSLALFWYSKLVPSIEYTFVIKNFVSRINKLVLNWIGLRLRFYGPMFQVYSTLIACSILAQTDKHDVICWMSVMYLPGCSCLDVGNFWVADLQQCLRVPCLGPGPGTLFSLLVRHLHTTICCSISAPGSGKNVHWG